MTVTVNDIKFVHDHTVFELIYQIFLSIVDHVPIVIYHESGVLSRNTVA